MQCICFVLVPLDNHEIVFGYESFTAALPSSRRQPCFPAFPAVARGVAFVYGCARRALRRIRFNRECHPSWHLRRLASRRYASHRNPTASAQAVCHPLSGGSVACLVFACASLHAGDRALCAVIAFQCFAVQLIAVQCLQFVLCRARRGLLCNGGLLDIA